MLFFKFRRWETAFLRSTETTRRDNVLTAFDLDSISRFRFVEVIGKGSFGKVWKVIDKITNELCALKIMDKAQIIANKCLKTVILEKTVLETLAVDRSDLISNIKAAFQDREKVYILM